MMITYFTTDKESNLKKVLYFIFVFLILTQVANGQCATPLVGCPNTNLSNFGIDSNNDAATIEYDNFVSSFHSTVVRTSNGSLQIWGEKMGNNGTSDVLSPLTINAANFPALTGTPLKAALGSSSTNNMQGIILATDGLYAWSKEGIVISSAITSSTVFQKLTINGNSNGLPSGVNPQDVKMLFATYKTLAITTCSGDVWVLSQTPAVRGNGAKGNALTWYRVTTSATGNPFLTDVVACRGNSDGLMALRSDGTVYVWGTNVLLGNGSAVIPSEPRAVKMTLPTNITTKMIGSTGSATSRSYYILATDGNLYSVGKNSNSELGDWTNIDRLSWVQPRYISSTGPVMNDIKWFSSQEHDSQYGAINVINNSKNIYAFGNNNGFFLGTPGATSNPAIPNGLNTQDQIIAVETGGHTSMIVKNCEAKFGYVGHRYSGSMGDGTNIDTNELKYTFATAPVQICGVESLPIIQPITAGAGPGMKYCIGDPVLLDPTPAGGRLSIRSGPGYLTGNTLNFTGEGTVVVQYLVATSCGGKSLVSKSFDTAICPVDLEVIKTVDNLNPSTGSSSIFTITAKNNGPYKATGVSVNDVLPSGYSFVSADPSTGTWSAPKWNIGKLSNGATATLSILATVKASGTYANTATITGNDPDTNLANNSSTATPAVQSNLIIKKTVNNAKPTVLDNITFTITASNAGPSDATGVSVLDVLPSGYTFVSATPLKGTWTSPNWFIGTLANGVSTSLNIVATVKATGNYNNTASITGTENDPNLGDNSSSVNPDINHAPVAVNENYTVTEDTPVTLNLLNLASDIDGDKLIVRSINGTPLTGMAQSIVVTNGTVNITAAGLITFTPDANFNSTTAITIPYVIDDGNGAVAAANVFIKVTAVNDHPFAIDDIYTVAEDETVTLNPLNLDSDLEGDTLNVISINGTTLTNRAQVITVPNGTLNISVAGVITFVPDRNFNSATPIRIPYIIEDGNGGFGTANQFITVTAVNDNPIAINDIYTIREDEILRLNPLDLDSDIDNDTLTIQSIAGTTLTGTTQLITVPNGIVNISAAGIITFTPDADFNSVNAISIPYVISDGKGSTATAIELITVMAVNDNPIAVDDFYTVAEDSMVRLNPLNLDSDPEGDSLHIKSINGTTLTGAAQVIIVANGTINISVAGMITFVPNRNFNSATPVSIPYVLHDSNGGTATANQLITVTAVNDNPVAVDDIYTMEEDGTLILNPLNLDSDIDGDILTIRSIAGTILTGRAQVITVANGRVNISASGIITFTPDADFNSVTAIRIPYVISDGKGGTATAIELITVTAVNEVPVAIDDTNAAMLSTSGPTLINRLAATDVDGTITGYIILSLPVQGVLALGSTPVKVNQVITPSQASMLTYDPSGKFTGRDTFTFTATDNEGSFDATPAVITLVISKALLEAVADPITLADGINGSLDVINVLLNDKLNGAPVKAVDLIVKGLNMPDGITLNFDGTIDVAPGTQAGNHTFTYQICEAANTANCATATAIIFVEIPAIAIVKTVEFNDANGNGYAEAGETLTYNFEIKNNGNTELENILVNDPLPGIIMRGRLISLSSGNSDLSSITGTYTLTQEDVNSGTITNQATASGITRSGIIVMDKSDFSDFNGEKPTVLELRGCVIKIFNAVSANGDNFNERFYIQGLECYPENTVQIYNRSGVLVFERDHYNNNDIAFRGISEGSGTSKDANGLPEGTYFYILRYKDKQSIVHKVAGYLYLTK